MPDGFIGDVALPGQSNSPFPSPALWKSITPYRADWNDGFLHYDQFRVFDGTVATNVGKYSSRRGPLRSYEDTGCSIAQVATNRRGAIRLTTSTTDNHEASIEAGSPTTAIARISSTSGQREKVIFECSVAFSSIADTIAGVFVGLAMVNKAVADGILADAGTLQDVDFIGFHRLEGDGDQIDIVYKASGQTQVTLVADALATAYNSPITALTADTFVKLGFVFDWSHQEGPRIEFFVNGQKLNQVLSVPSGFAATFPNAVHMTPLIAIKNAAAASAYVDLDFWAVWQEIVSTS